MKTQHDNKGEIFSNQNLHKSLLDAIDIGDVEIFFDEPEGHDTDTSDMLMDKSIRWPEDIKESLNEVDAPGTSDVSFNESEVCFSRPIMSRHLLENKADNKGEIFSHQTLRKDLLEASDIGLDKSEAETISDQGMPDEEEAAPFADGRAQGDRVARS